MTAFESVFVLEIHLRGGAWTDRGWSAHACLPLGVGPWGAAPSVLSRAVPLPVLSSAVEGLSDVSLGVAALAVPLAESL